MDGRACAEYAGLTYVSDADPGYSRRRQGKGFTYLDEKGKGLPQPERARIIDLVIPPAWKEVWICKDPDGHIQVTGRDSEGRKQYIYHPEWERVRQEIKFSRTIAFGHVLPSLRKQCDADLRKHGLPRVKAIAAVVFLLDRTLIRVGNDEYATRNESYGLTTLQDDHVEVSGSCCTFTFDGKSGKKHVVELEDRRLARIVRRCRDVPGQRLFQYYTDEGERASIESSDVNNYIREATGQPFTAKDFRTWAGSVRAAMILNELDPPKSEREADRQIAAMIKAVAEQLGNTPAVCRDYYIHPEVVRSYREGRLHEIYKAGLKKKPKAYLEGEEMALLHLLAQMHRN